ncbi:hypothetical protein AVP43_02252 [Geobacillus stearothermophilus]|nr:hypothetical protein AVP43_02252 [Geobacillus stearothermophilus]
MGTPAPRQAVRQAIPVRPTVQPPYNDSSRNPSFRIFRAALWSRSCSAPQAGHTHSRMPSDFTSTCRCPQHEHNWLEGKVLATRTTCLLQNKNTEICREFGLGQLYMERGRDSLFRHSQPLILLASWLFHHAPRGSMSSCNSLHFSLRNSVFFLCRKHRSVPKCLSSLLHQGARGILFA